MTYKIEWLHDDNDCETCGGFWSTGYVITKDGTEVISKRPNASCTSPETYEYEEALKDIIILAGIEVEGLDERY